MDNLKTDLERVRARLSERTAGDSVDRIANGWKIAVECSEFLRTHGEALAGMVDEARRYRTLMSMGGCPFPETDSAWDSRENMDEELDTLHAMRVEAAGHARPSHAGEQG